mmetsp:Transcript_20429/g.62180  ORF Transcript_20429/g.62180 Transcript_20429/m.62180 type:complete len:284 (-) Transcript_20429:919-1770(-)
MHQRLQAMRGLLALLRARHAVLDEKRAHLRQHFRRRPHRVLQHILGRQPIAAVEVRLHDLEAVLKDALKPRRRQPVGEALVPQDGNVFVLPLPEVDVVPRDETILGISIHALDVVGVLLVPAQAHHAHVHQRGHVDRVPCPHFHGRDAIQVFVRHLEMKAFRVLNAHPAAIARHHFALEVRDHHRHGVVALEATVDRVAVAALHDGGRERLATEVFGLAVRSLEDESPKRLHERAAVEDLRRLDVLEFLLFGPLNEVDPLQILRRHVERTKQHRGVVEQAWQL